MQGKPIAEIIDAMLAAEKEIGGIPEWQQFNYEETRLLVPLLIHGASSGAELLVAAYPGDGHKKYRIMLNAPKCIWRIDHVYDEPHVNSLDRPADLIESSFNEPHYHAWRDNRHLSTHAALPDRLPNARILQDWSFDSTLRWFCGEVNIKSPPSGLIDLPSRTTLL